VFTCSNIPLLIITLFQMRSLPVNVLNLKQRQLNNILVHQNFDRGERWEIHFCGSVISPIYRLFPVFRHPVFFCSVPFICGIFSPVHFNFSLRSMTCQHRCRHDRPLLIICFPCYWQDPADLCAPVWLERTRLASTTSEPLPTFVSTEVRGMSL
jgi:hypothetical protein